ncbi:MAG: 30S ribosomal protein S30 [Candidatus Muproteobacteria bacterium RBG_16_64_11]|uniref:30S ribosomal protein S30 n=1 Tax=Candidatus Muproteobacteria bacterium RBG_16_64_11 TaxID=1817758 RepID=A0A1F6TE97_9PROT|nr:MAG: 30S ribosomal protein S30 [Candidatus Muproteobacteria bacterium RBG_16_64_11]
MQIPLQITLRDMPPSEAVETRIREKAQKLDSFYDRIMSCRVVVESPQRHQHQGKLHSVRIDLSVPGAELVVNRVQHEDIYVAIRDAFNAIGRKLEDYARRQRGDVKIHDAPGHGRVTKIFPSQGYGFIETPDRRELYFNRNSVVEPEFEQLEIGAEVSYVEEQGKEGPQARRVSVGKHQVPE